MILPASDLTRMPTRRLDPVLPAEAPPRVRTPGILVTAAAHALRDWSGQEAGRIAGVAGFVGMVRLAVPGLAMTVLAGGLGALSAGIPALHIARNQIGHGTLATDAAVMLCTAAAASAGCVIASLGAVPQLVALAAGGTAAVALSLARLYFPATEEAASSINHAKALGFGVSAAAGLTLACLLNSEWLAGNAIAYRSVGWLFPESVIIELAKSALEQLGPSVNNRQALNFHGRVATTLVGAIPYVCASVLFNGYIAGLLQPSQDSHEFAVLLPAVMVGALSNAVRGAANATAAWLVHRHGVGVAEGGPALLRPSAGARLPDATKVLHKSAIRFFLSACRNAVYFELRKRGLGIPAAASLAQFIYAWFAQCRDLIYELMQGQGWQTEPVLRARTAAEPHPGSESSSERVSFSSDSSDSVRVEVSSESSEVSTVSDSSDTA